MRIFSDGTQSRIVVVKEHDPTPNRICLKYTEQLIRLGNTSISCRSTGL